MHLLLISLVTATLALATSSASSFRMDPQDVLELLDPLAQFDPQEDDLKPGPLKRQSIFNAPDRRPSSPQPPFVPKLEFFYGASKEHLAKLLAERRRKNRPSSTPPEDGDQVKGKGKKRNSGVRRTTTEPAITTTQEEQEEKVVTTEEAIQVQVEKVKEVMEVNSTVTTPPPPKILDFDAENEENATGIALEVEETPLEVNATEIEANLTNVESPKETIDEEEDENETIISVQFEFTPSPSPEMPEMPELLETTQAPKEVVEEKPLEALPPPLLLLHPQVTSTASSMVNSTMKIEPPEPLLNEEPPETVLTTPESIKEVEVEDVEATKVPEVKRGGHGHPIHALLH